MGKQIICSSCGAEFDNDMAKCPYCGTMNYEGAEKEYLEKLEDVREDLDDLNEVPLEETKDELKKQGRLIRKVLMVAIIIGFILFGWIMLSEKAYERDEKADFLWKSENTHCRSQSSVYPPYRSESSQHPHRPPLLPP